MRTIYYSIIFFRPRRSLGAWLALTLAFLAAGGLPVHAFPSGGGGPSYTFTTIPGTPVALGNSVPLNFSVTPVATDSVVFTDITSGTSVSLGPAVPLTTVTTENGTYSNAQLSVNFTYAGVHTLQAAYASDPTTILATCTQTINLAETTTTLSPSGATAITYGATPAFAITVTARYAPPTGTVTLNQNTSGGPLVGSATLVPGSGQSVGTLNLPVLNAGTYTLLGTYGGTANVFGASSSPTLTLTVNQATSSTALAVSPQTSAPPGQTVTLTATVPTGATGSVTFYDGGAALGPPQAPTGTTVSFSTTTLATGLHTFTATFAGDGNYLGSTSPAQTLTILTPSTTNLAVPTTPQPSGQPVTLTATVTAGATGSVTFKDNGTAISPALTLPGPPVDFITFVTTSLAPGAHSLTAVYGGDATYGGSTATAQSLTILATTTLAVTAAPTAPTFGQPLTLTATLGWQTLTTGLAGGHVPRAAPSPTGSVTFLDGATPLGTGTISGNTATFAPASLGAGPHAFTATYGGDATFAASVAPVYALTLAKATPVLTWANPASVTAGTVLGASQLNATANVPGTFAYTPPAGTVLAYGLGQTLAVTFTPTDGTDYVTASMTVPLDVTSEPQVLTFAALPPVALGAAPFALGATASSGLAVSYASSNPAVATVAGDLVTLLAAGTTTITASQAGDATWAAAAPVSQTLTVQPSTQPPALVLSALADGATTSALVLNLAGNAASLNGLKSLTVDGQTVPLDADGSFSWAVRLKGGANLVTTVATDATGLTTQDLRTITQDVAAPALAFTAPADNLVTSAGTVAFTGTFTPGATSGPPTGLTYAVNGGAAQPVALAGATFQFTATLVPGLNTLELVATSASGPAVHAKRTLLQEPGYTLAATVPLEDLLTDQATTTLTGTVADTTSPVTVTFTLDGTTYTPAVAGGTFTQVLPLPANQLYGLTIDGLDGAGTARRVHRNVIRAAAVAPAGYTAADVLRVLQIVAGLVVPTAGDLARYDLAPMVDDVSVGDGKIDLNDAAIVMELASGDW